MVPGWDLRRSPDSWIPIALLARDSTGRFYLMERLSVDGRLLNYHQAMQRFLRGDRSLLGQFAVYSWLQTSRHASTQPQTAGVWQAMQDCRVKLLMVFDCRRPGQTWDEYLMKINKT
jgi:hypothetical protein